MIDKHDLKNKVIINGRFLSQKTTGTQRTAQELSKILINDYDDYVVVSPKNIIHQDLANQLNVKIIDGFSGILWEQITLRNFLVKNDNPLLINFSFTAPFFYSKNIIFIHDLIFQFKNWVSKSFHLYYSFLIPKLAKKAVHICTVSEFSKNEIIKKLQIEKNKIDVVYNAISSSFSKKKYKNIYGNYILGVSTINERKNFDGLIEGFLKSRNSDYKLVLVGSKDKRIYSNIDFEKYKNTKNIFFTGYINDKDLIGIYSNAKLFVFPSFYEGFGLPPLEAMSCGCLTAVSNVTSIPEICGDSSIYFNPYDSDDIAMAINKGLTDENLKADLIKKGYKNSKKFNWSSSASKLNQIINKLKLNGK